VINAAYAPELFWDSRAQGPMTDPDSGAVLIPSGGALEIQALNPPLDDAEMAHHGRDWAQVTGKLAHARPLALASAVPPDVAAAVLDARTYPELFRRAFGDAQITPARIAMALATYQRTLIADRSPWDDWNAGDDDAMTPAQRRGFEAFLQGGCLQCHVPTHFTNHFSRNIGLRPVEEDMGLAEFTGNPFDAGRFRTPGVRNAGLRVSFMHNGRLGSLEEVVEFYADAEKFPDNLDPAVTDIQLDGQQRADLVEFLATAVTDPRLAAGLPPFDAPDLFRARGHPIENPAVLEGTGRPLPSGATPRVIAVTPPLIGADDFKVGLTGVPRGSIAELHLSWDEPADGMVPPDRVLGPFVADHPDGLDAVATAHWPIPFSPALNGRTLHMQWVVQAPGSAEPARSPAVRATLFCGFGDCATGCLADFDRDLTVGFADLAAFLGAFNQAQPAADLAEPVGVFNFFDLAAYLDAFNRGCP
jgi:cytochrome c peroxidase